MKTPKAPALWFLIAVCLTAFATPAAAQTANVAGSYTLTQINGAALPVTVETRGDCAEEVLSGTLLLTADGKWDLQYAERETCAGRVQEDTEHEDGDFSVTGSGVTFSDDTEDYEATDLDIDELGKGTLEGNRLTVTLQDGRTQLTFTR